MVKIKKFIFNPFQENTFLLYDETNECVVIDAGCNDKNEQLELLTFIEENELKLKMILNTHCHIDHIMGNAFLVEKYNVPSIAHKDDLPLLQRSNDMAIAFGFTIRKPPVPSKYVNHGEIIEFGNTSLKVLHVPGHSPGCIAFYCEKDGFIIVGDVLFAGSIGRTDLPGGDYDTIILSITNHIFSLPGEVIVYPGHGNSTTVEHEKNTNPYFQ
ncbi:MAG: MBL fold hydrolase [Bacteroidetes bacterium GWC2_33_15]|nr:MAG: MBL fold hydrolase [Bacteroidetes bacterium GWA2_33_15]OFX50061.1 MAG: MBL fold hydrolase [Bacteroidetes bacterium GWC2_33_15]OFX65214.1 MAG: MBL fold hydrolase [Bacteroidetes bacterium GWB2_32_14]OFX70440.1 MAG: MBL fold hydrolase [Bacteroidetes bacterium GWD2_33_33]HAN19689.1 MBL fold hydrolase [Bacteroidales bacterium]